MTPILIPDVFAAIIGRLNYADACHFGSISQTSRCIMLEWQTKRPMVGHAWLSDSDADVMRIMVRRNILDPGIALIVPYYCNAVLAIIAAVNRLCLHEKYLHKKICILLNKKEFEDFLKIQNVPFKSVELLQLSSHVTVVNKNVAKSAPHNDILIGFINYMNGREARGIDYNAHRMIIKIPINRSQSVPPSWSSGNPIYHHHPSDRRSDGISFTPSIASSDSAIIIGFAQMTLGMYELIMDRVTFSLADYELHGGILCVRSMDTHLVDIWPSADRLIIYASNDIPPVQVEHLQAQIKATRVDIIYDKAHMVTIYREYFLRRLTTMHDDSLASRAKLVHKNMLAYGIDIARVSDALLLKCMRRLSSTTIIPPEELHEMCVEFRKC